MKRFHGKELKTPDKIIPNTFQKMSLNKATCWLYAQPTIQSHSKLFLNRVEGVNLSCLDVYEVNAECMDGINLGYLFDTPVKRHYSAFNFIIVHSLRADEFSLKVMNDLRTNMELRFKLNNINLYSLGVLGSMVSLGHDINLKETLEF
jgi:hypothetical protein